MMNFCTLFNSYYLQRGIATYLSLERVADDFHLYVMAFDRECFDTLRQAGFRHMTVELLDDFETPDLLEVKPGRNMAEYCWTCSAAVTWHFITKYRLPSITYLDADLYFIHTPRILFDEIGDASIGLSEHWFGYKNERAGRFCVQFVYFRNDDEGMSALGYWRDSCIKWCFARYEDGKFGDQTYIEDISRNFKNVHIIGHRGCGLAPWNDNTYTYPDAETLAYGGKEYPVIFFHFHGIRFLDENGRLVMTSGDGGIRPYSAKLFYHPYLLLILHICNRYLGRNYTDIEIRDIPRTKKVYNKIKHSLHDNPIAKFFYYKVCDVRYNGYDKKK